MELVNEATAPAKSMVQLLLQLCGFCRVFQSDSGGLSVRREAGYLSGEGVSSDSTAGAREVRARQGPGTGVIGEMGARNVRDNC